MTRRRERPLHNQVAEFVRFHLADKHAYEAFTGTDYDAHRAFIHLVVLWGRTRRDEVIEAMRITVHAAQHWHDDVMAVFKKSIPCLLDWSDEQVIWPQIAPARPADIGRKICWPCDDGPRICHHKRSQPDKHKPGYYECLDCGAEWCHAKESDADR